MSRIQISKHEVVITDDIGNPVGFIGPTDTPVYFERAKFEGLLSRYGATLTANSDNSGAINEAFAAAGHDGKRRKIAFPECDEVRIDEGLELSFPQLTVDFFGPKFNAGLMTSGVAIKFSGQTAIPYNIGSSANAVRGLVLYGPDSDATTVDGVQFGGPANPGDFTGHGSVYDALIYGFRDNIVIDDNYFIAGFRNVHSMFAHRYGLHYSGNTNTGESINFDGGGFLDCENAGGTAIGVYVPSAAAGPDLFFKGTSFSYNNIAFDVQCGTLNLISPHFENKTNNPMGKIKYVGGRPSTQVFISGGSLAHGTLGSGSENANGRPVMFEIDSATGDRCALVIDGMRYNGFGKKETEFVKFSGGAYPLVKLRGIEIAASGAAVGRLCEYTNALYNAGFETGKTNGWTNSDGTNTVTRDTAVFNNDAAGSGGAASLKVVGASAGTTTYSQTISGVRPGDKILARGFMRCDAFTAGSLTIKLLLLDQAGTTITTYTLGTLATASAAWTLYGNFYRVTAGIASARLQIEAAGWTGTGYFDDLGLWVM